MAGFLENKLETKLEALEARAEDLSRSLADPDVTADMERFRTLSRSYAEIEPIVAKFREHTKVARDMAWVTRIMALNS